MKKMYIPGEIEPKWSDFWLKNKVYKAGDISEKPKSYILIEFPYPSGERLHVGHARSYSCLDAVARMRRMKGGNVLYPIGWDAFGLPAENYAVKTGIHPSVTTRENIKHAKAQAQSWGLSFDWDREVNTTDPEYYKWTQWIFIQLFKKGLAYKQEIAVNWCPSCKINLANEEVIDGKCERCGTQTERRKQSQWLLKITAYADRLLEDLKTVNFREDIALQQVNWIGKKEGINIRYKIVNNAPSDPPLNLRGGSYIEVFTTRPDTNFGATFIVLAPEHPLIQEITNHKSQNPNKNKIIKYVNEAINKSELDRQAENKKKTGVFTGLYAINDLTGYKMPIWVSDFVLSGFGTGALVGVPGHDLRDFDFAREMGLEIKRVVVGKDGDLSPIVRREQVQEEEGTMINSGFLDGLNIHEATEKIMDYMEKKRYGKRTASYHLRDWVFSRQHYWGEPIPMIFCKACAEDQKSQIPNSKIQTNSNDQNSKVQNENLGWFPVPEEQLPVVLPPVEKYQPTGTGESPLGHIESFVNTTCPNCGRKAKRETDTMPNWAGSSWYFLRYIDPHNDKVLADPKKLKYWLPVDWYNGGMEHTTLHLLYSRFWHKFLYDLGVVPTPEPYAKRTSHGVVLGPDGRKMSKSKGNVINPDEIVRKYGADTLRMYEMFMGPFDQMVAWSDESLEGVHRFLKRIWKLAMSIEQSAKSSKEAKNKMARLIKTIEEDLEDMKFNTAVAAMMEFSNWWGDHQTEMGKEEVSAFIKLLAPMAPFIAEEMYQQLNPGDSIHIQPWPKYEEKDLAGGVNTIVIQVNGKVRALLRLTASEGQGKIEQMALEQANVAKFVGKSKYRVIWVPGKILNFVI
jgi:leucyl-tRNA synthetase